MVKEVDSALREEVDDISDEGSFVVKRASWTYTKSKDESTERGFFIKI